MLFDKSYTACYFIIEIRGNIEQTIVQTLNYRTNVLTAIGVKCVRRCNGLFYDYVSENSIL